MLQPPGPCHPVSRQRGNLPIKLLCFLKHVHRRLTEVKQSRGYVEPLFSRSHKFGCPGDVEETDTPELFERGHLVFTEVLTSERFCTYHLFAGTSKLEGSLIKTTVVHRGEHGQTYLPCLSQVDSRRAGVHTQKPMCAQGC